MKSGKTKAKKAAAPKKGYHHGDLRRALIDAALTLIEKGDLATLSLREVARQAGVTYAAPYHHFPDKTSLLAVLAEEGFRMLSAREAAALASAGEDETARLAALGESYVAFALEHPAHYRVMFGKEVWDRTDFPSLREAGDEAFGHLLNSIDQALKARRNPTPAMPIALTAWSAVHGLSLLWNEGILAEKLGAPAIKPLARQVVRLLTKIIEP